MRVTTGSTRAIQGVCQGVSSANTFCISTQRWAVRSVRGPKGRASNRSLSIVLAQLRRLNCAGSIVLAKHGFDDIGDRRELEWLTQEGGVHTPCGFGDGALGE